MIPILIEFIRTPEAEAGPGPWLTRLFAHAGLGAILCAFYLALPIEALTPVVAVTMVAISYAALEILELRLHGSPSRALMWDSALDWVGVMCAPLMLVGAWERDKGQVIAAALVLLIVAIVGVKKRSR